MVGDHSGGDPGVARRRLQFIVPQQGLKGESMTLRSLRPFDCSMREPELREDRGEVPAAKANRLPSPHYQGYPSQGNETVGPNWARARALYASASTRDPKPASFQPGVGGGASGSR
jgi:hypothetical protein